MNCTALPWVYHLFCLHRRSGVGEQQQEEDETADEARHSIFCDHGRTPRITRLAHYVGVRDIPKELRVQIYSWPESGVLLGFYTYELEPWKHCPLLRMSFTSDFRCDLVRRDD
jgi:hypothetical protein